MYVRFVVASLHEIYRLKAHSSKYDGKQQESVSLFILFQAFLQFSFWIFEASLFKNNSNFNDSHVSDRINEQLQESLKTTKEVKNEQCSRIWN